MKFTFKTKWIAVIAAAFIVAVMAAHVFADVTTDTGAPTGDQTTVQTPDGTDPTITDPTTESPAVTDPTVTTDDTDTSDDSGTQTSDVTPPAPSFLRSLFAPVTSVTVFDMTTLQAALANSSITHITFANDITVTTEMNVTHSVTIDGAGHHLFATFTKNGNLDNAALGVISTDSVTIKNLIEDGTGSSALHGFNLFASTNVVLDGVTASNNSHNGIVVNGTTVTVNNITTSNNGWGGIDVDQGSGVTTAATLTINGTSTHNEPVLDIFKDDNSKSGVSVVDTNNQYTTANVPNGATTGTKYTLTTAIPTSSTTLFVGTVTTPSGNLGTQTNPYPTIQSALNAAVTGDTIDVLAGTYTEAVNVNKSVTITGEAGAKLVVNTTTVNGFTVTANNVTIENFDIEGPATSSYLTFPWGGNVTRGIFIGNGVTGFAITNNTVENLRNNILIDGRNSTGSVTGNTIDNSKSGISIQYTDGNGITITGNTQGANGNEWGVNLHLNGYFDGTTTTGNTPRVAAGDAPVSVQQALLAMSTANAGWAVQDQGYSTANRTLVTVSNSGNAANQGSPLNPITSIQTAISDVVAGGVVNVQAGSYTENLDLNKAVTITGPNAAISAVNGTRVAEATLTGQVLIEASNTAFKGFTITNSPSFNGPTIKGVQISSGVLITNINVSNNIITNITNAAAHGAYGIMIQGVLDGVTVDNNNISNISATTVGGWARGIEITTTSISTIPPKNVTITNNKVSNITSPTGAFDINVDGSTSTVFADASQATVTRNNFDKVSVNNIDTAHSFNVSQNYWGTANPDFTGVFGNVTFSPWYIDAAMTTLSSGVVSGGGVTAGGTSGGTSGGGITPPSVTTPRAPAGQVLGAQTFNFTTILKMGSRGDAVKQLQTRLNLDGANPVLAVDGIFGPKTRAAVIKWQKAHGLVGDGIVGPKTRAALNA